MSKEHDCFPRPGRRARVYGHRSGVYLVGPVWPIEGGIAAHVGRLARLLARNGWHVRVYYDGIETKEGAKKEQFEVRSGHSLSVGLRLLADAIVARPNVVHFHVSAFGRAVWATPLMTLMSRVAPVMITVHSGSFPIEVERSGRIKRLVLKMAFSSASRVVAVNAAIRRAIVEEVGAREVSMDIVPAYIRPFQQIGVSAQRSRRTNGGAVIVASGYGTPTYWWEGLLSAVQGLDGISEVILCFYGRYEAAYFDQIMAMARDTSQPRIRIERGLSPAGFLRVLSGADVFIRPTLLDGDSIAVREALSLGMPVVASDAVERPEGVALFRAGCIEDLRRVIARVIVGPGVSQRKMDDFSEKILEVYRRTAGSGGPNMSKSKLYVAGPE